MFMHFQFWGHKNFSDLNMGVTWQKKKFGNPFKREKKSKLITVYRGNIDPVPVGLPR